MKVRFTRTTQFESEGRNQGPIFEAGKTYDMEPEFAQKWIKRGVAEPVEPVEPPYREVRGRTPKADTGDDGGAPAASKGDGEPGKGKADNGGTAATGKGDGEPKVPARKAGE